MTDLPREWTWADLGIVANVQWGNTSLTKASYIERGYSAFSAAGCDGMLSTFEHDGCGIVLSAIGARCGKCFLADGQWTAIKNTITITSARVDRDYLYYYLNNEDRWPNKGGAQPFITLAAARSVKVPLPPLREQRRIVAKIDSLTGKSRRARDHLDHIPRLVEKYKQAILAAAFRGDLTQKWRETREEGCWRDVSVSDVSLALFDGPFGSNLKSSDYTQNGIRVVRLENIGHLHFIREKQTFVSEKKYTGLTRHTLQSNDILVSSFVADEMRVCLFPHDLETLAINKADCFCIRPDTDAVIPKFVELRLASSETYKALEESVHGATRPRISLTQLRSFRFGLPPREEQAEIVRCIESAFIWVDRLTADTDSARRLIDHLDQSVLAKAFKGELVPQDPADEPASALLDRIRAERTAAPKAKRGRKKAA